MTVYYFGITITITTNTNLTQLALYPSSPMAPYDVPTAPPVSYMNYFAKCSMEAKKLYLNATLSTAGFLLGWLVYLNSDLPFAFCAVLAYSMPGLCYSAISSYYILGMLSILIGFLYEGLACLLLVVVYTLIHIVLYVVSIVLWLVIDMQYCNPMKVGRYVCSVEGLRFDVKRYAAWFFLKCGTCCGAAATVALDYYYDKKVQRSVTEEVIDEIRREALEAETEKERERAALAVTKHPLEGLEKEDILEVLDCMLDLVDTVEAWGGEDTLDLEEEDGGGEEEEYSDSGDKRKLGLAKREKEATRHMLDVDDDSCSDHSSVAEDVVVGNDDDEEDEEEEEEGNDDDTELLHSDFRKLTRSQRLRRNKQKGDLRALLVVSDDEKEEGVASSADEDEVVENGSSDDDAVASTIGSTSTSVQPTKPPPFLRKGHHEKTRAQLVDEENRENKRRIRSRHHDVQKAAFEVEHELKHKSIKAKARTEVRVDRRKHGLDPNEPSEEAKEAIAHQNHLDELKRRSEAAELSRQHALKMMREESSDTTKHKVVVRTRKKKVSYECLLVPLLSDLPHISL